MVLLVIYSILSEILSIHSENHSIHTAHETHSELTYTQRHTEKLKIKTHIYARTFETNMRQIILDK